MPFLIVWIWKKNSRIFEICSTANFFKKWRKQAGLSQEKLANLCGTAPAYIRQIEIGNRSPSIKFLVKVAGALKIDTWQLLYEDPNTGNESPFEDYSVRKTRVKKELVTSLSKTVAETVKKAFEEL
ncbi:helix-turn-helix domain-containing protein [Leadbettera azotonutricia]|uniref:DNA-binding protein n=1 Tax=Leadbettera azotonutricia (strain ATCC BAA-888 / DSM 13862 / ZAS-9) TaxID=545695 RepID=F5YC16_LEAAZ|nr:helix-turn-helix transcriptional regulator [Leadbettera azotonutricia]AEF82452.1 DNA-binding protein [Leadbettera azotonutricia ZAS-9]